MGPRNPSQLRKSQYTLLDRKFQEIVGKVILGTGPAMANDNSIPQITEGIEVFDVDYTPRVIGSLLILTVNMKANQNTIDVLCNALFINNASDAVRVDSLIESVATRAVPLRVRHEIITTSLDLINFKTRIGTNNGGTIITINSSSSNFTFGDRLSSWLLIEEWAPPGLLK